MKNILLLLTACMLCVILSCTKNNDNNFTGKVLHGSTNYLDSLTINTSTYSILYQGSIYTYTASNTANYISMNISYNGAHTADATLMTTTTSTTMQLIGGNTVFQSPLYIGN